MMFINISNHPSENWSDDQRTAAESYGQIIDLPFPEIEPDCSNEQIVALAREYMTRVKEQARDEYPEQVTVMVAGEFTFTYQLVDLLQKSGYRVVSACTRREAEEQLQPDGSTVKVTRFAFVQFREYQPNQEYQRLPSVSIDEKSFNTEPLPQNEKKCVIILALSTIGYSLKESKSVVSISNEPKDTYYGAYQLEAVSQYIISKARQAGIKNVEFVMLATTATKEDRKKEVTIIQDHTDPKTKREYKTNTQNPTAYELFCQRMLEYVSQTNLEVNLQFWKESVKDDNVSEDMPRLLDRVRSEVGPEDEVYIDVHGGPRATQQLLLNLLSILGEEGIHIQPDHILTADGYGINWTIKTAGEGFRINDFVAGIHEFVNYGRIDSLNNFYNELEKSDPDRWKKEMSPVAKNLIDTMKNVSSAIQLCDMAWFDRLLSDKTPTGEPNLVGLPLRLAAFKNSESKSSYLGAFLNLIESGYGQLLKWSKDKKCYDISNDAISEIEWCRDKGLYQQMLTICESAIPRHLVRDDVSIVQYDGYLLYIGNKLKAKYERYNYLFNNIVHQEIKETKEEYKGRLSKKGVSVDAFFTISSTDASELREMLKNHGDLKDRRNHSAHGSMEPYDKDPEKAIDNLRTSVDQYLQDIKILTGQTKKEGHTCIYVSAVQNKKTDATEQDVADVAGNIKSISALLEDGKCLIAPESLDVNVPTEWRDLYRVLYTAACCDNPASRAGQVNQYCQTNHCSLDLFYKLFCPNSTHGRLQKGLNAIGGISRNEFCTKAKAALDRSVYKAELITELAGKPYH